MRSANGRECFVPARSVSKTAGSPPSVPGTSKDTSLRSLSNRKAASRTGLFFLATSGGFITWMALCWSSCRGGSCRAARFLLSASGLTGWMAWGTPALRWSSQEGGSDRRARPLFPPSGIFMLASNGSENLIRARPLRNCRYSHSCTCSVEGLMLPILVLTCSKISGKLLNLTCASLSTLGRSSQKYSLLDTAEQFIMRVSEFNASLGSSGPWPRSRMRNGARAPLPTSL
mmetsp:Transcript_111234/g.346725  ORF Transcript_111234/g.346725 Transcript_111234/m.346725 type:complete len:230 (-) Transcript_111234:269-958(-)